MNIQDIKERHSKIGGTPWKASEYSSDYYTQGYRVKTWNNGEIASCIDEKGEVDFIANAPSDIAYLLSIIEQSEKTLKLIANGNNEFPSWGDTVDILKDVRSIAGETLKSIQGDE